MPHLVVSITGHGFGHVAQTAPVLNLLHERIPELHLTVRSSVPLQYLRSRIRAPFDHIPGKDDSGMVMSSALDVRVAESRAVYQALHADWKGRVDAEAELLRELNTDAVFSNAGYLTLAGAQRAGIANVALCSLNWFDIYRHYCGDDAVAAQIHDSYANADAILRTTPGMPMETLPNLVAVGPVITHGANRRNALERHLRLSGKEKLVLASMGGIAARLPVEQWPRIENVRWLVQKCWQVDHPDAIEIESLPLEFPDLLASADALLCKPGYGSFVEAACSGIPVLYVDRPDWPESPALIEWLQQHGTCRKVSREQMESGSLAQGLAELWLAPGPIPPVADGTSQVADWLQQRLSQRGD